MFSKKSVGIDISDGSIEVAEISKTKVLSLGRIILDQGVVIHGRIKDEDRLASSLKEALLKAKPTPIMTRKAFFGLPEEQVYSHVFEIEKEFRAYSSADQKKFIEDEATRSIPLEKENLIFTHQVLEEGPTKTVILLLAASKTVMQEWDHLFSRLKISVDGFDTELFAIARSIFGGLRSEPACVVDMGTHITHIAIFDQDGFKYARSMPIGGASFTHDVAQSLKIHEEEAEDRKIKIGLSDKSQNELFILIKALEPIADEIKTAILYYTRKTKNRISRVYFVGGASYIPGLLNYFETNLNMPVSLGTPSMPVDKNSQITHTEAIGLALRAMSMSDPLLSFTEKSGYGVSYKIRRAYSKALGGVEFGIPSMKAPGKTALVIAAAALIIFLAILFIPKNEKEKLNIIAPQNSGARHTATSTLTFEIPIALDAKEQSPERVRGRTVEIKIEGDDLLVRSLVEAERELKTGEKIWQVPVSETKTSVRWAIYSEDDFRRSIENEIKKIDPDIKFEIAEIAEKNLKGSQNPNVVLAMAAVIVLAEKEIIQESQKPPPPPPPVVKTPNIRVKSTETGWLNVRSGPGTNFDILLKIYPGEIYPLLENAGKWAKIELKGGKIGWVASQYIENEQ